MRGVIGAAAGLALLAALSFGAAPARAMAIAAPAAVKAAADEVGTTATQVCWDCGYRHRPYYRSYGPRYYGYSQPYSYNYGPRYYRPYRPYYGGYRPYYGNYRPYYPAYQPYYGGYRPYYRPRNYYYVGPNIYSF